MDNSKNTYRRITHAIISAVMLLSVGQCNLLADGPRHPGDHRLQFFGFAFVDCGIDDPFDTSGRTNYVSEVAAFSNVAHMCAFDPDDSIIERLQLMSGHGLKAALSVQDIFFTQASAAPSSGANHALRPDYRERWTRFVTQNDLATNASAIQTFFIFDEPASNGVTYQDLKAAADLIKAYFPSIPILLIEAYTTIDALEVPRSVDWIGFNRYGVLDPGTDARYQDELVRLKAKRSAPSQRIVIVMDGWWREDLHGAEGLVESDMATVATHYYRLATSDPDVIGIAVFLWPGVTEHPKEKGTRNLPQQVIDEYTRIGKRITGK